MPPSSEDNQFFFLPIWPRPKQSHGWQQTNTTDQHITPTWPKVPNTEPPKNYIQESHKSQKSENRIKDFTFNLTDS